MKQKEFVCPIAIQPIPKYDARGSTNNVNRRRHHIAIFTDAPEKREAARTGTKAQKERYKNESVR